MTGQEYDGYLIDLDGTMYLGEEKIEEAPLFIERLREKDKKFLFLTNNSMSDPEGVAEKLNSFDVEAYPEEVYTSSQATRDYLLSKEVETVYVIGGSYLHSVLEDAGFTFTEEKPEAVVVGMDTELTYGQLTTATFAIQAGAEFIGTNPDTNLPTEKGLVPGAGATIAFLEVASSTKATIIGKPEEVMIDAALEQLNLKKDSVVMVGDNYETDILFGINNGLDTLMVFTGLTTEEELKEKDKQPTYTVQTLNDWEVL